VSKLDDMTPDQQGFEHYETIKACFKDLYENHPKIYDIFSTQQITQSDLLEEMGKVLRKHTKEGSTVLDIGCGTGVMISLLAPKFPKINFIGVDPAEKSLILAKEKSANYGNVSFRLGTVEQLEEKAERFDVVFSTWGHIHWNLKGYIMERVAAENGVVMLVNNWGEDDDFSKLWPICANNHFIRRRKLLEDGNFHVVRLDSHIDLTDDVVCNSVNALFGEENVTKYGSNSFQIGIVMGWKKVTHTV